MKKSLLFVLVFAAFLITACGSSGLNDKKNRTVNDLMDGYVRAYIETDVDAANSIFPDYYYEKVGKYTKEKLEAALENGKNGYGDDFNITYEITKTTKLTDEELVQHNENIRKTFNAKTDATECYKYEGTITFKGSKFEDTDPIDTMLTCKYNDEWYLTQNTLD